LTKSPSTYASGEDKKPGSPASFDIDQLGFNLKGVSNASNAPVTAALSLRFAQTGTIAVNGSATLIPPRRIWKSPDEH